MAYSHRLPSTKDIIWLSKLVTSYPVTRRQVVRTARMWNFKNEVISFLRQFPAEEVFESRADFVNRSEDAAVLIRQEWESPKETATSYKD